MNEFLNKIAKAMELESVAETDDLKALPQWDSLAKLCVIAMMGSDYGITIGSAELQCAATPGELWELMQNKTDLKYHER